MKKNLNILIIADTLDVDASSGAKASMGIVQSLVQCGYRLKVLHYSRKSLQIDYAHCIRIPEKRKSIYYLLSKLFIVLNRYAKISLKPFIEKVRGFSFNHTFDVNSIKKAIEKENPDNYDWIFALSYAGSFRAHKAIVALPQWHSKFIAYVHDPYPQASYPRPYDWVEPGHQEKRNFFIKVCKSAEHLMYPSLLLAEWMESYYHAAQEKRIIIPHQFSQDKPLKEHLPSFMALDKFSVLHAGSLMRARNPKALCQAFTQLCDELPNFEQKAQLLFVGHFSSFHSYLEEISNRYKAVYVHPDYLPFKSVLPMQYAASVNVVLEAKAPYSPFLPGKVPHCIVANKPLLLLGPPHSETRRLLGETEYPYWAENDNVCAIKNLLSTLFSLYEEGQSFKYDHEIISYFKPDRFRIELEKLLN